MKYWAILLANVGFYCYRYNGDKNYNTYAEYSSFFPWKDVNVSRVKLRNCTKILHKM